MKSIKAAGGIKANYRNANNDDIVATKLELPHKRLPLVPNGLGIKAYIVPDDELWAGVPRNSNR